MKRESYVTGGYDYTFNMFIHEHVKEAMAMVEGLEKGDNIIIFYNTGNDGSLAAFAIDEWARIVVEKAQVPYNIVYVECSNSSEKHWSDHIRSIPVREQNMIFVLDLPLIKSDIDEDIAHRLNTMCKIWCDSHSDTQETKSAIESGEIPYDINFNIYHRDDMCSAKLAYMATKSFEMDLKDRSIKPKLGFVSLQDMPLVYELIDIYHRSIKNSPHWDEAVYLDYIASCVIKTFYNNPKQNFWYACCYDKSEYNRIIEEGYKRYNMLL